MAMTAAQKLDAYRFFAIAFDAVPGVTYMNQLDTAYAGGMTTQQIVNVYTTKAEFLAVYPTFFDNTQFATKLVETIVGTAATAANKTAAVADIVGAINAGSSRGDVIFTIFSNLAAKPADDADWGATSKLLANQVAVAQYYTETLLGTATDLTTLRGVIGAVTPTTDVSTPAALAAVVNSSGTGAVTGSSFTLTTGQDYADTTSSFKNGGLLTSTFVFSGSSETVTAGAGTLGNTDALVDGATTDADVLNATLTSGAAATTTIQNIETINLTSTIAASGLGFANVLGAKTVTVTGTANSQLTSVNSNAAPAIQVNNFNKVLTLSAATLAGTAAAGTADTLTVQISGVALGGTTAAPVIPGLVIDTAVGGALETLNLASVGATKNTLALSLDAAGAVPTGITKTVLTGTADLDLRVAHALVSGQTLDTTGYTGALNLVVDRDTAGTAATNLTNFAGVKTYTFRDSTAGTDIVVASGLTDASTAVITESFNGANSLSVKSAASGATNVLNVTLDHVTDATNVAIGTGLTIADIETINFKSEGGTTTGSSIAGLVVDAGAKVTVDGATKLDLQLAAASAVTTVEVKGAGAHKVDFAGAVTYASGKNLTIDGSTATGKLTLDGSDFTGTAGGVVEALTIKGGTTDDTITATANVNSKNVIDAGAGVDTVSVATNNNSNVTLGAGADKMSISAVSGAGFITFTDWALGTGGDVLSVAAGGAGMTKAANGAAASATTLTVITAAVADDAAAKLLMAGVAGKTAVVAINSATGVAELWFDADGNGTGGPGGNGVKLAAFENITTVGTLTDATSGFIAANFGTWA